MASGDGHRSCSYSWRPEKKAPKVLQYSGYLRQPYSWTAKRREGFYIQSVWQPYNLYHTCRSATVSVPCLSALSRPARSSCSVANGSLWFPGSAPEMFSCGDLVRSALSWSLRLPLGLSTLFIPRPPRPQTAKWVELWPVMWSGPGVTGERPESVELTTLLTIKRQPDTASSSSPLCFSKGRHCKPMSPRGETQYSKPTNEQGS